MKVKEREQQTGLVTTRSPARRPEKQQPKKVN